MIRKPGAATAERGLLFWVALFSVAAGSVAIGLTKLLEPGPLRFLGVAFSPVVAACIGVAQIVLGACLAVPRLRVGALVVACVAWTLLLITDFFVPSSPLADCGCLGAKLVVTHDVKVLMLSDLVLASTFCVMRVPSHGQE